MTEISWVWIYIYEEFQQSVWLDMKLIEFFIQIKLVKFVKDGKQPQFKFISVQNTQKLSCWLILTDSISYEKLRGNELTRASFLTRVFKSEWDLIREIVWKIVLRSFSHVQEPLKIQWQSIEAQNVPDKNIRIRYSLHIDWQLIETERSQKIALLPRLVSTLGMRSLWLSLKFRILGL